MSNPWCLEKLAKERAREFLGWGGRPIVRSPHRGRAAVANLMQRVWSIRRSKSGATRDSFRTNTDERPQRRRSIRELLAQRVAMRAAIEMTEKPISLDSVECANDEDGNVALQSLTLGRWGVDGRVVVGDHCSHEVSRAKR
jgi:hypothetical protein